MNHDAQPSKLHLPTETLSRVEVLVREGLYVEHDLRLLNPSALALFRHSPVTLDAYCPGCRRKSVFKNDDAWDSIRLRKLGDLALSGSLNEAEAIDDVDFESVWSCSRNPIIHQLRFYFAVRDGCLSKVGQVPSHATLEVADADRFKGVLDAQRLKELKRGVGLTAHGAHIGGFVYVRRVLEQLVEDAHLKAIAEASWDERTYGAATTKERIQRLSRFLPALLVKHSALYGILSKGVHELTEEECGRFFPVVKEGIELILDDMLAEAQRKTRERAFDSAIGKATSDLGRQDGR